MRVIDASKVVIGDMLFTERRGGPRMRVTHISGTTMLTFFGVRVDGPFAGALLQLTRRKTSAVWVEDVPVLDVFGTDKR